MSDEPLSYTVLKYQLAHVKSMLDDDGQFHDTDDGRDYMGAALELAHKLMEVDNGFEPLDPYLHEDYLMDNFACDGVAPEIWKLAEKLHPSAQ